ncbi:MAG: ABC transporter permease [Actinomycetota bacterium]
MTTIPLVRHYLLFAGRSTRRLIRSPDTLIATVGFPVILLLSLLAVFSTAVEAFGDGPYIQRLVPGLLVSGLMFGSSGVAVGLMTDLNAGFMDRVRSMPVAPSSPLAGAAMSEILRALIGVAALVAVGIPFGFRFSGGVGAAVVFVLIAALGAFSFSWIGLWFATRASSFETLGPPLSALFLVLLFFSQGMVPLDGYPGWAQPLVRVNPASAFVRALTDLANGDAAGRSVGIAILWSVILVAVFAPLAARSFKDAARR